MLLFKFEVYMNFQVTRRSWWRCYLSLPGTMHPQLYLLTKLMQLLVNVVKHEVSMKQVGVWKRSFWYRWCLIFESALLSVSRIPLTWNLVIYSYQLCRWQLSFSITINYSTLQYFTVDTEPKCFHMFVFLLSELLQEYPVIIKEASRLILLLFFSYCSSCFLKCFTQSWCKLH